MKPRTQQRAEQKQIENGSSVPKVMIFLFNEGFYALKVHYKKQR